jgi:VanZ family protein
MRDTPNLTSTRGRGWKRLILPVAWMAAIFLASGQQKLPGPEGIPGFDKLAHLAAYGLLATLWARALNQPDRPWRTALIGCVIASVYGLTDEFHQSFTPGRSVEFADWVADTAGAALGVAVYCFWPAYRALMDRTLFGSMRGPAAEAAPFVAEE